VFFRKKGKYTDVEGYNRISRLIEDRQRELSDEAEPESDFDDEGVLLTREPLARDRGGPRTHEESPTVSSVRPIFRVSEETTPASTSLSEERRIPFQPDTMSDVMPEEPAPEPEATVAEGALAPAAPSFQPQASVSTHDGCVVAAEASWEGKLSTSGDIRVDGTVRGEIETGGTLYVSASARIEGTVQARSVVLAGEVEGQVTCSERLEILAGGTARGEIETASLVVHEGAFIDSRFQMTKAGAPSLG